MSSTPLQQKIAELERLTKSEQLLRAAFDSALDGLLIVDDRGHYVDANPAACALIGLGKDALLGQHVRDIADPDFDQSPRWRQLLADGRVRGEFSLLRPDGGRRDVEYSAVSNVIAGLHLASIRDITASKATESALRASEARFRGMIEHSTEAIWLIDSSGTIVYASPSTERLLGYGPASLVGTLAFALIVEADRGYVAKETAALVRDPSLGRVLEFRVQHRDGSVVWVESMGSNLLLDPAVGALVSNFRDVTKRKLAEAALAASQGALEDAHRTAHLGSWSSGLLAEDRIEWSIECARIFGGERSSPPTAEAFLRMAYQNEQARLIVGQGRASSEGGSFQGERCILLPSGEKRWIYAKTMLERIDGALPAGCRASGIVQDITERRHSDEARDLLAAIVDSSDDAIISRGIDGTIRTWNRGAERLMQYSAKEAIGAPISMFYPPEDLAMLQTARERTDAGAKVNQLEMVALRKDGSRIDLAVTTSVLVDAEGKRSGAAIIARDITERRKAEAALRRSEEQLRQAQKMEAIGSLAGGVAHDFNNLLSVILAYTKMVTDELKPNDPLRDDLHEVHQAGLRAAELTRQLLAFSRKQVLQPVVLDLNQVVIGIQRMLQRLIGEDIALTILASPLIGKVHADLGQVEQVIMNLVVNARDAMPTGGHITIETANAALDGDLASSDPGVVSGDFVLLAVTDTGTGMDAATKARVFEPFFTTKDKSKGTGLGLSTVYGIVEQSGGHIRLSSEPGEGTTFKVYLPRTDRAPEGNPLVSAPAQSLRGTETILLVEDNDQVRVLMVSILRRHGYHVIEAQNAGEAFLSSQQFERTIDLLLTDVVMPRMSGRVLAERLVVQRPEMKVLYVSGYTDDTVVQHGIIEDGVAFLHKPIAAEALLEKVRQVLDTPPR